MGNQPLNLNTPKITLGLQQKKNLKYHEFDIII